MQLVYLVVLLAVISAPTALAAAIAWAAWGSVILAGISGVLAFLLLAGLLAHSELG
jgi:hypothetical protein